MKAMFITALWAASIIPAAAAEPIMANRALSFQGSNMVVEGQATVRDASADKLGGAEIALANGSNSAGLVAYIPKGNLKDFPNLAALNGRTVDVSGVIVINEGQPEIRVSSPAQLHVVR